MLLSSWELIAFLHIIWFGAPLDPIFSILFYIWMIYSAMIYCFYFAFSLVKSLLSKDKVAELTIGEEITDGKFYYFKLKA